MSTHMPGVQQFFSFFAYLFIGKTSHQQHKGLVSLQKTLSGSMILLAIPLILRIILQNIWRRVVDDVLINISPSNIFLTFLLPASFHQKCKADLGCSEHKWLKAFHMAWHPLPRYPVVPTTPSPPLPGTTAISLTCDCLSIVLIDCLTTSSRWAQQRWSASRKYLIDCRWEIFAYL